MSTTLPTTATRIAVVTGAGRGIGAAIARRLAADGATVVVSYGHDADAAARVVASIEADGGSAVAVRADISKPDDIRSLFEEVRERFGGLDILVNNAGIGWEKPIGEMPVAEFEQLIGTNLVGTFLCMQHAAALLRDGGRVVSISSGSTRDIGVGSGALAATKAGIEQLSKSLALELAPRRITVNVIVPHIIESDGLTPAIQREIAPLIASIPLGGPGQPADIAAAIAFFVSDDAHWITGQTLPVTGGL